MGSFLLLGLVASALLMSLTDMGDAPEDTPVDADETDTTDKSAPVDDAKDLGASFEKTDDGVTIKVGEDETRSVVAIHYRDPAEGPEEVFQADEVRYYLVDEETDWSQVNWENRQVPGGEDHAGGPYDYTISDFEKSQGLELIGVVDVSAVPVTDDPDDRVGVVTSNAPIKSYYLTAVTDTDALSQFLPEDYVVTRNGVPEVVATADTTGGDGADWISTDVEGLTLDGAGGDDVLVTRAAYVTLRGGLGDDTIESLADATTTIDAGSGDDHVSAKNAIVDLGDGNDQGYVDSGTVQAGSGDDTVYGHGYGEGSTVTLFGGAGDDNLTVYGGADDAAYGGDGNDTVRAFGGGLAYGVKGTTKFE